MYHYQTLYDQLKQMHINPHGILMVHSSMKSIGEVEGGADTVLDVLCHYMKDGLLLFPTHTWGSIDETHTVFDSRTSDSCVGILTNLFYKRPGVVRSLHATHSIAALGKDAEAFIAGEERATTPCPKEGCWSRLYDQEATILFIGCRLNKNTFIHSVEEWHDIPDRLAEKALPLTIFDRNGQEFHVDMHQHHCSFTNDISQRYIKMEEPFAALGALHTAKLGDAPCFVCNAKKMGDITNEFLKKDPTLFADFTPVPTDWYTAI